MPLACRAATRAGTSQAEEAEEQLREQGRASPGTVPKPKRRCHNPSQGMQPDAPSSASPDEDPQGPLALLPEGVLDHIMSLLAAENGGSCIRSTCRGLCNTFDRCNSRLVLRGTAQQLPDRFPARLLDLVRCSPCVSSLTLAEGLKCVTWPQVLEAGGPQLLHRLERLSFMHHPHKLDLEALAACTRLQHLYSGGCGYDAQTVRPALLLPPLAACGGTLQSLDLQTCSQVHDFTPLAACAEMRHLALYGCCHLQSLAPLTACVRLQQLRVTSSPQLQDLSPLTACVQLQTLHITGFWALADLGPLAACAALRKLDLRFCHQISDLSPLASCTMLQHLDLLGCKLVEQLAPLAACAGLQELNLGNCFQLSDLSPLASCAALRHLHLWHCRSVVNLAPLAACVGLQRLALGHCSAVEDLSPLASCLGLEWLDLEGCMAPDRRSLAALPRLSITPRPLSAALLVDPHDPESLN